jgi:hypothetical protein
VKQRWKLTWAQNDVDVILRLWFVPHWLFEASGGVIWRCGGRVSRRAGCWGGGGVMGAVCRSGEWWAGGMTRLRYRPRWWALELRLRVVVERWECARIAIQPTHGFCLRAGDSHLETETFVWFGSSTYFNTSSTYWPLAGSQTHSP